MTIPCDKNGLWWDRELDVAGRPIRPDVRAAAHEIWGQARNRVHRVLGEASDAAGFMERSVVQISRHLDRIGSAPNAQNTASLLMCAFCRALRRHAAKLHRIELVGDLSELAEPLPAGRSYSSKEDLRLDAEKAARRLSQRGRTMLELRQFGFEWKEIAEILHTTRCAARAEFSREVKRVRLSANKNCPD